MINKSVIYTLNELILNEEFEEALTHILENTTLSEEDALILLDEYEEVLYSDDNYNINNNLPKHLFNIVYDFSVANKKYSLENENNTDYTSSVKSNADLLENIDALLNSNNIMKAQIYYTKNTNSNWRETKEVIEDMLLVKKRGNSLKNYPIRTNHMKTSNLNSQYDNDFYNDKSNKGFSFIKLFTILILIVFLTIIISILITIFISYVI